LAELHRLEGAADNLGEAADTRAEVAADNLAEVVADSLAEEHKHLAEGRRPEAVVPLAAAEVADKHLAAAPSFAA